MNNNKTLKEIQEPLKAHYKSNPEAALVTLKAQAKVGEGISCKIESGKALVEAGLHPATGGDGLSACSGDMLLEALAACAGVTLNAVATAIDFDLKDATVYAEGLLDFRGTLSVDKDAPVGFKSITLRFDLSTNENEERIQSLLKLTERFCVVYQTLAKGTELRVEKELHPFS
ncbi:OsmC family protein [Catalinimonas niigatensis]|uniref:OsmC family protein n=1 Tax=Catalinimonas niigatensis TaxID=1397264 RepID=UPI0026654648|nr:OsmC family protein [Catalinimonas niigatensis]WPP50465.1 OsmC family protein [Catalinimonas niigatensis]